MKESLNQTADAGDSIQQTVEARVSISDSRCKRLYIRLWMQESLYQTADARVSISDSGCKRLYIR